MRKQFYLIFLILISLTGFSQKLINITVKDSKSKDVLRFCNLVIEGTTQGYITNGDGKAQIRVFPKKDILVISYIGYNTLSIPTHQLKPSHEVLLVKKNFSIDEVMVVSDDAYLYDIMQKCRKTIIRNKTGNISKVYYGLESESKGQPIEFLECYYNGHNFGLRNDQLLLKNGRVGLSTVDENYFLSQNSAKAISDINLIKNEDKFPSLPLQYGKRIMKDYFTIEMIGMSKKTYHLKFFPNQDTQTCFSGEIWIERETYQILKIDYTIDRTDNHPFLPLFSIDTLNRISFNISNTFKQHGENRVLDFINFSYILSYKSSREYEDSTLTSRVITREIKTKGLLHFYDYDQPFILPYFEYDNNLTDYMKLSFIPYNEKFWSQNNNYLLTKTQKENLGFFSRKGQLINFNNYFMGKGFSLLGGSHEESSPFFEFYYSFWKSNKRIVINREKGELNRVYPPEVINETIQRDLYHLDVEILLDISLINDTLFCKSYTIFDIAETFFHLPSNPYTIAFLNIYFDICEIERRKMQALLDLKQYSKIEIDEIYKDALSAIKSNGEKYFKEVNLGENEFTLTQWNRYVFEHLEIDNLKMVRETYKDYFNAKALDAL